MAFILDATTPAAEAAAPAARTTGAQVTGADSTAEARPAEATRHADAPPAADRRGWGTGARLEVRRRGRGTADPAGSGSDLPVGARRSGGIAMGHVVLAIVALCCVLPVYWLFATAFRKPEDQLSQSPFPWPLSVQNFIDVAQQLPILSMMWNTLVMAVLLTVFQLLTSVLAAYAFARFDFPGKSVASFLFVGSWLVPFQITMIPNYLMVSQLGLLNTIAGVVVPNLVSAFGVLLLLQHMRAFPGELLDAATIDGLNSWQSLWRVVVPNMKPALAALSIMLFISAWNDYLWPSLILRQSDALIQVGIRSFLTAEGSNWGAVMAAAGMACLPVFLLYVFLQKHVVAAFVRSGLK